MPNQKWFSGGGHDLKMQKQLAVTYLPLPVHVDTWRSTYSGIVPDEVLTDLSYEKRENAWQNVFEQAVHSDGLSPTFQRMKRAES